MGYRASLYFVDTEAWDSKRQCKFYGKGGCKNPQIWLYPMWCSRTTFASVKSIR